MTPSNHDTSKKDSKFLLEKTKKEIVDSKREITWLINILNLFDYILDENMELKKILEEYNDAIQDFTPTSSILVSSVTTFHKRLNAQEKNVGEYLDEFNENLINTKLRCKICS